MVPFIDVMLVLLIIFMVTAPLIAPSVIDLPNIGKANKTPDQIIQIVVTKDEVLSLKVADKTSPATLKDLVRQVRAAQANPAGTAGTGKEPVTSAVVISADKNVKYESVVKVMDALQRGGIQRVGLSVQLVN